MEIDLYLCCVVLDSTGSYTIESAGVWLDNAEGFPLSQFCGEWGFVSFQFLINFWFLMYIYVSI